MTDDYRFWVDHKIDLILSFLRDGKYPGEEVDIVDDLRICHDQARASEALHPNPDLYRRRSNKMLISVGILRKKDLRTKERDYLEALEGVLLHVMMGKT